MFKKTCNLKEFSMTSPETILPQISTKSRPSDEDILLWYEKGLTECQANYQNKTSGYATEKVGPPLMNRQVNTRNNLCRGNAMLYQTTGLLVWPFGPIDQCSTNSECWFGFLTCGSFQQDKLTELFNSGYQSDPHSSIHPSSFKEWSIKALDITSRIVGLESLVPFVSHVTITANNKHIEVILAQYTLTIPGHYTIEMRLQGLYPGLLYNWKPEDLSKGVEMYHSIFLGGSEGRCPPYVNCGPYNIPLCDVKSLVGNAPYRMKSTHRVVDCPSDKVPSILPLCHGGNNPGRWIRIPDSVLEVCGASKFEKDMKDEHQRQFGKRQDFNKYAAIVTAYAHHTQHLSEDKMWESVKHHSHQSNDNQIYYDILSRYAGGNICALANIEDLPTPLDGRLELFAPYDCKYRLFTSEQVTIITYLI